MSDDLSPLARALGRVPTGLYVITAPTPDGPVGFVGSFLVQVGLEPPTVCVAVGHGRAPLEAIRAAGRFGVSVLDADSRGVMSAFFKKYEDGASPFDGLAVSETPDGSPVLSEALAWLECRVSGEHDVGDHVVVFGEVLDGALAREGEPTVHLRKNGLSY